MKKGQGKFPALFGPAGHYCLGLSVVVAVLVVDAGGVVAVVGFVDAAGAVEVVDLAVGVDLSFLDFLSVFVFVVLALVSDFGASAFAVGAAGAVAGVPGVAEF